MWKGKVIDNPYNKDIILVFMQGNKYYFENKTKSTQSKTYTMLLGLHNWKSVKFYTIRQLELYTGRKHLFIQEEL